MSRSEINTQAIADHFNGFSYGRQSPSDKPQKRPPPYSIRFTDKEREILQREAKGASWADYIRECVFGRDFTPRQCGRQDKASHAVLAKLLGELGKSRLASNLNQIAKAVNMGALPVTPDLEAELKEACADIRMMRDALISALGIKVEW